MGNEGAWQHDGVLVYGGTAAYWLELQEFASVGARQVIESPYGTAAPIVLLTTGDGLTVGFSSRHGEGELQRSAGFVNHRANVWAAQHLGFRVILSWNGVGAISPALTVGDLLVPDDLLDWTASRRAATFERWRQPPAGPPFDPALRRSLLKAATAQMDPSADRRTVFDCGTYVCTEGPRLETKAEIALFAAAHADVVGMTLSPEVWLARELGIGYASLCYVTNYATGMARGREQRRDFGPGVARRCLSILLAAAAGIELDAEGRG